MSKHEPIKDEMREEYDFSNSVRAPYAAMAGEVHLVMLDPDVNAVFKNSDSVNEALRLLIRVAKAAEDLPKSADREQSGAQELVSTSDSREVIAQV
jgi:hypothetical protein